MASNNELNTALYSAAGALRSKMDANEYIKGEFTFAVVG